MARTKRVFISDLHMGTAESVGGEKPYGWLLPPRAKLLAEFLEGLAKDQTLAELVIVGDLFDEWVVPYSTSPVPVNGSPYANQFARIAEARQNAPIIKTLVCLTRIEGVTVTYVPGNHDMLIEGGILTDLIPGIQAVIAGPGRGVHIAGNVAAEHGSLYCLFNAPDEYDNPGHCLPLGFFIARTQAEGVVTDHPLNRKRFLEAILESIPKIIHGEPVAGALFESLVDEVKSQKKSMKMNGMDGYQGELELSLIASIFADLCSKWHTNMPGNVPTVVAALGDAGNLFPAVLEQYVLPYVRHRETENIVVLGHTHVWEVRGISFSLERTAADILSIFENLREGHIKKAVEILDAIADPGPDAESDFVYANTGTWIDGDSGGGKPPATFVVIDEADERRTVEARSYAGGDPSQSEVLDSRRSKN